MTMTCHSKEIWKDIQGYEGIYQVSSHGRVRSKHKIMKPQNDNGYMRILLRKNGKVKRYSVHRLVAIAFIDNPYNLPVVNHKDENKGNNYVENLEWCTHKYNTNYGNCINKRVDTITRNKSKCKKAICVNTGEIFESLKEAGYKYNVNPSSIISNCKGKIKSAGKHNITNEKLVWRYYNES